MAARQIIAPRLGRFHRAHPEVALDIVVDDALRDIVAGRFDAGIRVGGRLEKDMIAVRLTPDVKMIVVASPAYLAHRGMPRAPTSCTSMPASTGDCRSMDVPTAGSSRERESGLRWRWKDQW